MQVKKAEVKNCILKAAREEFVEHGFKDASIRNIAKLACCAKSNIYNYFENKDGLFNELVEPTVYEIEQFMQEASQSKTWFDVEQWKFEWYIKEIDPMINLISKHMENLELLLFKAEGSRFHDYAEKKIVQYAGAMDKKVRKAKTIFPEINVEVSIMFWRNLASFYLNILTDCVSRKLSPQEMRKPFREFVTFFYFGQKKTVNWNI